MNEDKYIPGIFNYCDSWCERCAFTDRCQSYTKQDEVDNDSEALLETLHNNLQEAIAVIRANVEEKGGDWDDFKEEAANAPQQTPELTAAQENLIGMASGYNTLARNWLKEHRELLQSRVDELNNQLELGMAVRDEGVDLTNALDVIRWYLFLIQSKLHRALQGLHDGASLENDPIQNDANGSAKVSLIAVENSLAAWEMVRKRLPDETDSILDLLVVLGRLRYGIERTFVHVREFIRPGFDD